MVSREGNSGTTTLTFTGNLSSPAPAGGVVIHWATATNGSAIANFDYISARFTLVIPAGSTSRMINITVYGGTTVESDEKFLAILVPSAWGVVIAESQGVGTIFSDAGTTTGGKPKPRSAGSASTTGSADSVFSTGLSVIPDASLINWLSDQGKKPA